MLGIVPNEVRTHESRTGEAVGARRRSAARASASCSPRRSPARRRPWRPTSPATPPSRRPRRRVLVPPSDPGALSRSGDRRALRRAAPRRDGPRRARTRAGELRLGRHRAPPRGDLRRGRRLMLRNGRWRVLLVVPLLAAAVALIILARPGLAPRPRRVHGRALALGGRWRSASTCCRCCPVRLSWDTTIKQSLEAAVRASRSSSRRSRSGCSRMRCCPAASASSRVSPSCAGACRAPRHDGNVDRLGVRPPDVRPVPGDGARRLGPVRREDPGLGADVDRDRAGSRRDCSSSWRSCLARQPAPRRARRARAGPPIARPGPAGPRRDAFTARCGDRGGVPVRRAGPASCSRSGRRCTRFTSTSRSRPPASCSC